MRTLRTRPLSELTSALPASTYRGEQSTGITGISFDSREIQPGDLFVALRGGYFDGHSYINSAIASGASALLLDEPVDLDVAQVIVTNTRSALAKVAAEFYGHPSRVLTVVGVTGTDGKTTTTYLIDDILQNAGRLTGVIGTVSVRIAGEVVAHETRQTTPESLDVQRVLRQMVDAGVDTAILEATSHGLDLHRLDETKFDVAAVTNITHEHLEHHKSIPAYRRAKAILFKRVAAIGGDAVINLDDPGAVEMKSYSDGSRIITYSCQQAAASVFAKDVSLGVGGSSLTLVIDQERRNCRLPLVGGFNVSNALCAAGVATALNIGIDAIVSALEHASTVPGRMARVDQGQAFSVIVDYAHTPDSLSKVLQLLRDLSPNGQLIAVSGSAGERDVEKRSLQGAISARLADVSVFTTEYPRFEYPDEIIEQVAEGARSAGGRSGASYHCVTDRRDAIALAFSLAQPGDVVLLAGKGHERSIIWGLEKRPWDEVGVARELLAEMGYGDAR